MPGRTYKADVAGSNPAPPTNSLRGRPPHRVPASGVALATRSPGGRAYMRPPPPAEEAALEQRGRHEGQVVQGVDGDEAPRGGARQRDCQDCHREVDPEEDHARTDGLERRPGRRAEACAREPESTRAEQIAGEGGHSQDEDEAHVV